jgi:hypothetical protein
MLYIKDQANVEWVAKVFCVFFFFTWILVMLWVVF